MANELAYFVPLPGYTHQKTEGKEGTESLVFPSNGRIELPRKFFVFVFCHYCFTALSQDRFKDSRDLKNFFNEPNFASKVNE